MEIKLDKQLAEARGQAVSDIMEIRKAQPERTEFYAFIANRSVAILHKFIFNPLGQQIVNIYQTKLLNWKEGSPLVWQFMFTEASKLGFIPALSIQITDNGLFSAKHYHSSWSKSVCLFQINNIISSGTAKRSVVASGFVENPKHSTKEQQREEKIEVIVKYSPLEATNSEIENEIKSLDSLQKLLRKHNLDGKDLSIPILIASGVSPVEKYPYVITYPKGTPIHDLSAVGDLISFTKALNEALVHAHANKIFHADVSLKNIVMHGKQPILIDWGYAIQHNQLIIGFTGTLTFASIKVSEHFNDSRSTYTYKERDDFESLFYVTLYLASENYLPWAKEKKKVNVAKLKKDAMGTEFNVLLQSGRIEKEYIPFLQELHTKLFSDLNANVKSLFDD